MKKILTAIILFVPLYSQDTFSEAEVLKILEDRDSQWKQKLDTVDKLISAKDLEIVEYEKLIHSLLEQGKVDSLLLIAKDKQIDLLNARDKMNEKMVKLVSPKWYENKYIMVAFGFVLGIL